MARRVFARCASVASPGTGRPIPSSSRKTTGPLPFSPARCTAAAIADSAPAIAKQLYLSSATVKTHLQHLYEKLGVSDRAAAVAEAMRRGLLE